MTDLLLNCSVNSPWLSIGLQAVIKYLVSKWPERKIPGVGDIWAGSQGSVLGGEKASPGLMRNQETLDSVNKSQHTAFHCAAREGHLKVVQFLLSQAGGNAEKNLQKCDL